jgi:hypothetical protein
VFETAVEGLRRAVGGAGTVEVGQDVVGPVFQRPAEPDDGSSQSRCSWRLNSGGVVSLSVVGGASLRG